jgi:hypothetical protein
MKSILLVLSFTAVTLAACSKSVTGFQPLPTNSTTLIVMFVSIIGVLQSVLNKRKIRCACLGAYLTCR